MSVTVVIIATSQQTGKLIYFFLQWQFCLWHQLTSSFVKFCFDTYQSNQCTLENDSEFVLEHRLRHYHYVAHCSITCHYQYSNSFVSKKQNTQKKKIAILPWSKRILIKCYGRSRINLKKVHLIIRYRHPEGSQVSSGQQTIRDSKNNLNCLRYFAIFPCLNNMLFRYIHPLQHCCTFTRV